jgi:hypothetical protein
MQWTNLHGCLLKAKWTDSVDTYNQTKANKAVLMAGSKVAEM